MYPNHQFLFDEDITQNLQHLIVELGVIKKPEKKKYIRQTRENLHALVRNACEDDADKTFEILNNHLHDHPNSPWVIPWLSGESLGPSNFEDSIQAAWFTLLQQQPVKDAAKYMLERLTEWLGCSELRDDDQCPVPLMLEYLSYKTPEEQRIVQEYFQQQLDTVKSNTHWQHGALRVLLNNQKIEDKQSWLVQYMVDVFTHHLINSVAAKSDTLDFRSTANKEPVTLWPELKNAFDHFYQKQNEETKHQWFDILAMDCYIADATVAQLKELCPLQEMEDAIIRRNRIKLDIHHPNCMTIEENQILKNLPKDEQELYLEHLLMGLMHHQPKYNNDKANKMASRISMLMENTGYILTQLPLWRRDETIKQRERNRLTHVLMNIYSIKMYDADYQIDPVEHEKLLCALDPSLDPQKVHEVYEYLDTQMYVYKEMELKPPRLSLEIITPIIRSNEYGLDHTELDL